VTLKENNNSSPPLSKQRNPKAGETCETFFWGNFFVASPSNVAMAESM
jgi:hypothetical protein